MPETAATPAPTPAAAPVAPTGPGDSLSPVQTTVYSEDDQIIEQMQAEVRAGTLKPGHEASPKEPAKAKDGGKGKPKASTEPAAAPASAPASGASHPAYETPEEAVTAILTAFESGDTKALAKATGKPEAFFKVTDAKWSAFREQTAELKAAKQKLTASEQRLSEGIKDARAEFGKAIQAAKAYREGDMTKFVELVSELSGEGYDEAQRKVIQGELAADPQTKALRRQIAALEAKEKAREDAAKRSEQTEAQRAEQARLSVNARIANELKGHAVSKVRGYQDLILDKVRESWSPSDNAYTMGIAEAADAVVEDRRAEAEALGYGRPEPAPQPAPTYAPKAPSRTVAAGSSPSRPAWETETLDDDEIIAGLVADQKAGRLR